MNRKKFDDKLTAIFDENIMLLCSGSRGAPVARVRPLKTHHDSATENALHGSCFWQNDWYIRYQVFGQPAGPLSEAAHV